MTTPTKKPSKTAPSTTMQSSSQTVALSHFSMSSIAAIYASRFAEGFSNNERQASVRALLRHDTHIDGTHYHMKNPGGLHPSYIAFNPTVEQTDQRVLTQDDLLEAALQDVFDAVSYINKIPSLNLMYMLDHHARSSQWWHLPFNLLCWHQSRSQHLTRTNTH